MIFLENTWGLAYSLSFYLLLGLLAAGFLHLIVPNASIRRHLGGNRFGSVLKAAAFGIPLPFCSCSVVPFAVSLKKSGAGNGAVVSFLIATPITGADSIAATYGVFGGFFTLYRVITSLLIAIVAGVATNLFALPVSVHSAAKLPDEAGEAEKKGRDVKAALDYALNTVFRDIAKPLAFGILLGGIITTFVPADLGDLAQKYYLLTYLAVILIAPPLYICATSSIPVAASLIAVGVPAGAAFVLLTAGPATSTVTMSVIYQNLGRRVFAIYLSVMLFFSLIFGMALDWILETAQIDIREFLILDEAPSPLFTLSTFILLGLLFYYVLIESLKNRLFPPAKTCDGPSCGCGQGEEQQ
jgi:hypothetical protein